MIILEAIEGSVIGEPGKVFSTGPEVAAGADGKTYFIKGRNNPIAFSEVVGCRLAALAGLKVPEAKVGSFNGDLYAAVEEVPQAQRNIRPWLHHAELIQNRAQLFEVIAVDTWLANDDRNLGNVVGSALGNGRIEVFMIDFEKSRALAENPFMGCGSVDPKRIWPREELGTILAPNRPAKCPDNVLTGIRAISGQQLYDLVMPVAEELPFIRWQDSSVEVLKRRAANIDKLVEAVWATN